MVGTERLPVTGLPGTVTYMTAAHDTSVPARLLAGLNPEQRDAVTTLEGPLLVVAGPGSGKTHVLTRRMAALAATGTPAYRIAGLTFTNRAASHMRERVSSHTSRETATAMTVSTFHSLCARILRTHGHHVGLGHHYSIAGAKDSRAILDTAATDLGLFTDLTGRDATDALVNAGRAISNAKNNAILTANDWEPPDGHAHLVDLWTLYQRMLTSANIVDFDDLQTNVLALRQHPAVAEQLMHRYSHLLVDEYQDTNLTQHQLMNMFDSGGNVCAVGDPDQSIYAFRGAAGGAVSMFTSQWPLAHTVVLDVNYRSVETICAASRAIIAGNPADVRANTRSAREDSGEPIVRLQAANPDDEAHWCANAVTALRREHPDKTAAILVRANYQTRVLEKALTLAGVEHDVLGTAPFAERKEVKDLLSWLRLCVNPRDVAAVSRASGVPRRGIGRETLRTLTSTMLANTTDVHSAAELLSDHPRGAKLQAFSDAIRIAAAGETVSGMLEVITTTLGVGAAAAGTGDGSDERKENIQELRDYAAVYTRAAGGDTSDFVHKLSLDGSEQNRDDRPVRPVVISTIHASKGKEYDWVAVVGCENDVLPHVRAETDAEIAEERRLMFVACSRAKEQLIISSCDERMHAGRYVTNDESMFIAPVENATTTVQVATAAGRKPQRHKQPAWESGRMGQPRSADRVDVAKSSNGAGTPEWSFGDKVVHPTFGDGAVTAVARGMVTVAFGDSRTCQFLATTRILHLV